ncbi:DUF3084 domain-containing protein [Synechococcus sp. A15-24]|uniref:DUF3084 domain-containing protein n=1 Tax=Synechococcus sp. A15-24 TaxID=1050635 RepID=UPI00164686E8|nr:DUF3084 domain-containing protein [Synechococcus sp. A15-24]QNJ28051.1 conserved hypothetical protein (DUF3084) [Synechococcus sp. A15-24]
MSGWLLILALLILGGVLSTLGDRLGSRVGKARLSLFNLRPRRTAVLITVLTGSLISALSLGLLLLVSRQLRVGLFELDALQARLRDSRAALDAAETERREARSATERIEAELISTRQRSATLRRELEPLQQQKRQLEQERNRLNADIQARDVDIQRTEAELRGVRDRIKAGEKELKSLEQDLLALRRGSVVLRSGQALATATVRLEKPGQAKQVVDRLLQEANQTAYVRVRPGETPDRQILLVPRGDVERLQQTLRQSGTWVVSMRSAGNVLRGESVVYAYPDVKPNRTITRVDEVLATTTLEQDERGSEAVRTRLNLLLASAFAEVQRRGSLSEGLQFDGSALNELGLALVDRTDNEPLELQVIAVRSSDTADPVAVRVIMEP